MCALLKNDFYNLYIDIYGIGTIRTSLGYTKLQKLKIPKSLIGSIEAVNEAYSEISRLKEEIKRVEAEMQGKISEYLN